MTERHSISVLLSVSTCTSLDWKRRPSGMATQFTGSKHPEYNVCHLKAHVCANDVVNDRELWLGAQNACQTVQESPAVLERVHKSLLQHRLHACLEKEG
ncbi:hypothetical protein PR048_025507 [Dryococelus australis]|uniref:Uncharacterized protein n=1 Tax=Dryococelus australis TaxID=614101 RepID=A0ABQ9GRK2_9NEOP|nr:hypothetical protein PR048_025507 [Dryococelus australis]